MGTTKVVPTADSWACPRAVSMVERWVASTVAHSVDSMAGWWVATMAARRAGRRAATMAVLWAATMAAHSVD